MINTANTKLFNLFPPVLLFLISMISCSTVDLSEIIPNFVRNKPINDEKKHVLVEKETEIKLLRDKLSQIPHLNESIEIKNNELIEARYLLNSKLNDIEKYKKKLKEKEFQVFNLNNKLRQLEIEGKRLGDVHANNLEEIKKKEKLLGVREIEVNSQYEKMKNEFKNKQKELEKEWEKRILALEQRENVIQIKEKNLRRQMNLGGVNGISEETLNSEDKSLQVEEVVKMKTISPESSKSNYENYNKQVLLDKYKGLFWTRLDFYQKEGVFPETSKDCREWTEQMSREKYGGINSWRVPTRIELSHFNRTYPNATGGDAENFNYWVLENAGINKIVLFEYKLGKNIEPESKNLNGNCRLVSSDN